MLEFKIHNIRYVLNNNIDVRRSLVLFFMNNSLKTKVRTIITSLLGQNFNCSKVSSFIASADIISFDVFDTLIMRTVSHPTDVFSLLHPEDSNFKIRRIEAERIARAESLSEDITLHDIYKKMYPKDEQKQYDEEQSEINTEFSVCKANPEALTFFDSLKREVYERQDHHRIIIISDMYLSKNVISTILKNCGYDINDIPVYVSSEYGLTKRSGSLFREVLKCEHVEKSETVLHIGDNLISDYIRPRKCGMKSFLYSHSKYSKL